MHSNRWAPIAFMLLKVLGISDTSTSPFQFLVAPLSLYALTRARRAYKYIKQEKHSFLFVD